jgi:hypothetical protein
MESIVVTVKRSDGPQDMDLALPLDVPLRLLFPALCQLFNAPVNDPDNLPAEQVFMFLEQAGRKINAVETLSNAGVMPGDILTFSPTTQLQDVPFVSATMPGFVTPDGAFHEIQLGRSFLGRSDPSAGLFPSQYIVDLAKIDGNNISSRQHAQVKRVGSRWIILDLGSKRGTFINDKQLKKGEQYELQDGDIIRLGEQGIKLRFQVGIKPG